jgi:hypothetical protein
MHSPIRLASSCALVVVLAACGGATPGESPGGPAPVGQTASAAAPTAPRPSAAGPTIAPSLPPAATAQATLELVTFTSPLHGFSFAYPAAWEVVPATAQWQRGEYVLPGDPSIDSIFPEGSRLAAQGGIAVQPLPPGMSADEWLAEWAELRSASRACDMDPDAWTDTVVDGAAGRRIEAECTVAGGFHSDASVLEVAWVIDRTGYLAISVPPSIGEILVASFQAP